MNDRERFLRTMRYEPVDHRPLHLVGAWEDTIRRWRRKGLPEGVDADDFLGVQPFHLANVGPAAGIFPPFEERVIRAEAEVTIALDSYGRKAKPQLTRNSGGFSRSSRKAGICRPLTIPCRRTSPGTIIATLLTRCGRRRSR